MRKVYRDDNPEKGTRLLYELPDSELRFRANPDAGKPKREYKRLWFLVRGKLEDFFLYRN